MSLFLLFVTSYMESIVNSGAPLEDGKLPSMYFYAGMAHQMLADLEVGLALIVLHIRKMGIDCAKLH